MENRFLTIEDLGNLPPPKWLVEGLFELNSLVMLVGPPGAFKSFLALDWALSMAAGRKWNSRQVAPCRVLYALGEGKASLLKRLNAWIWHNDLNEEEKAQLNANFRVTFHVPQMSMKSDVTTFITDLDVDNYAPDVLFIDTLARSLVGKDENSQLDAGLWVDGADRLRQRGMAVVALHHTKKNTEFGLQYRGSSALRGAMDTELTLHRDPDGQKGCAKLACSKQKDHEEFEDVWLRRERVEPPGNIEGSIILQEITRPNREAAEEEQTEKDKALDEMIISLLGDDEYTSDRARARALAEKMGINEGTAQTKISRSRRKQVKGEHE
jgi:hypothetical protein